MALGIGDGEEITVRIVAELRHAIDGVGQQRDVTQGIERIDRLLSEGINDAALSSRRIQHPLRLTIEWIFARDQIAQLIGERGDVVEWVIDRERLTLGIYRDGRDLGSALAWRLSFAIYLNASRVIGRSAEVR